MPRHDITSAGVVGFVLAAARDKAGLTQDQLAARAGMDRSYVSDVERGLVSLSVDRLLRLCQALDVPAASIAGRIERQLQASKAQNARAPGR